jgi:hypothetical protein
MQIRGRKLKKKMASVLPLNLGQQAKKLSVFLKDKIRAAFYF